MQTSYAQAGWKSQRFEALAANFAGGVHPSFGLSSSRVIGSAYIDLGGGLTEFLLGYHESPNPNLFNKALVCLNVTGGAGKAST